MSTTTARLGLSRPQRGDRDWDDDIQGWLDKLDTYGAFGDETLTWTAAQTFAAAVTISAATTVTNQFVVQPAAPDAVSSGDGTEGTAVITMYAGAGGATTDAGGVAGGNGAEVNIFGGAGGNAPAGSTNGAGGNVQLTGGTPGQGAGTDATFGDVVLVGNAIDVSGRLRLEAGTQLLIADDTTLTFGEIAGVSTPKSVLVLTSDDVTATNRTMLMPGATAGAGQVVMLVWMDTNAGQLLDDAAVADATGNVRLSADWTPTQYDTLTLLSVPNGANTDWVELCRSTN